MPLSLGRVCDLGILALAVGSLLVLQLPLQTLEIEVAQSIGTEATGLEVLVGGHVGVLLQQVGYPAEDGGLYAVGMQALEQQQRLEVGVGRAASIHPPGVCSARAMGLGRKGSHGCEGARERGRRGRRGSYGRQTGMAYEGGDGRVGRGD
jgi:hypothetical protein